MRFETHSHSMYSNIRLIDSINRPADLIKTAAELGYSGITLTDHETLSGHIDWLSAEKELKEKEIIPKNFKCALGNEIYLVDERGPKQRYYHFILIAKNTTGHRALRELSSTAWLNSYRDRAERVPTLKKELEAIVKKYPNSLIATNACIGGFIGTETLNLIDLEKNGDTSKINESKEKIDNFLNWCLSLFGDDFYFEIAPGASPDQKRFNARAKSIANFYGLKMIVATDAHFLRAADRNIHKAFLNSKDGDREVDSFYHDAHLMNDDEAYDKIKDYYSREEFEVMCNNSLEIMDKIENYNIFHKPIIPQVKIEREPLYVDSLSNYPTLQGLRNSKNPQEAEWTAQCLIALKEKDIEDKEHFERLELEATIIKDISQKLEDCLFSYFNTFRHYIDLFWKCGSVVGPGRGSAGSFLSNYLLGITQIDPIKWNLPYFRFLNEDRAELPDIDVDLAPSKRPLILEKIREERGALNVVQVATFGTESTKSAILAAARGYRSIDLPSGIDVDIAQYMSNLVPSERGFTWSLKDCLYGDEEKGRRPVKELINQMEQYPGFREIVEGIEGLVCRRGQHASGVILYNNSPFETTALMRSPNGDLTTQFDLHQSESLGDVKFDFLVTDICDKISVTLDLLIKDSAFGSLTSKRDIYNKYLHPQSINLSDKRIWDALAAGSVQDVFQFNTQIGIQTAKAIQPQNPSEMTSANALLRLAAPEGQERPLTRYIRFKNDISLWYKEMDEFGLSKEEEKILEPYYLRDYGVPVSQEALMLMVMDPNISNFSLAESNNCRKVLAKKKIKEIPLVQQKFFQSCKSRKLAEYTWRTMMQPQMSYSFSEVHALLYSFIGIQTLVLATNFPSVYWNTACLIVNSQSIPDDDFEEIEEETPVEDEIDEEEAEELKDPSSKKSKTPDYGRIASAIGRMKMKGILVYPPDINKSSYTFKPDVQNNRILYGLSGITGIGDQLIREIIAARPYGSFEDFLARVKMSKPKVANLIKSGAFDSFGKREEIMEYYLNLISDKKKAVNLRNLQAIINYKLLPVEFEEQERYFFYNKYLRKLKNGEVIYLDEVAFESFGKYGDMDLLIPEPRAKSGFKLRVSDWDKIWKKQQDKLRPYIKAHEKEYVEFFNSQSYNEMKEKYGNGNISSWEMASISYYFHNHELENVSLEKYGLTDYFSLSEDPVIERYLPFKGRQIPIFKLYRIAGTVLEKDKIRKSINLLTPKGVVSVKLNGEAFAYYDRQISQVGEDGKKHVIEKSFLSRGNKVILTGIRREDSFVLKKYKSTPYHLVERIVDIDKDGAIQVQKERAQVE